MSKNLSSYFLISYFFVLVFQDSYSTFLNTFFLNMQIVFERLHPKLQSSGCFQKQKNVE